MGEPKNIFNAVAHGSSPYGIEFNIFVKKPSGVCINWLLKGFCVLRIWTCVGTLLKVLF